LLLAFGTQAAGTCPSGPITCHEDCEYTYTDVECEVQLNLECNSDSEDSITGALNVNGRSFSKTVNCEATGPAEWTVGEFSTCSPECGSNRVQTRTVSCSSPAGCIGPEPVLVKFRRQPGLQSNLFLST